MVGNAGTGIQKPGPGRVNELNPPYPKALKFFNADSKRDHDRKFLELVDEVYKLKLYIEERRKEKMKE